MVGSPPTLLHLLNNIFGPGLRWPYGPQALFGKKKKEIVNTKG